MAVNVFSEDHHFGFQKNIDPFFSGAASARSSGGALSGLQKTALFMEDTVGGAFVHQGNKVLDVLKKRGAVDASVGKFSTMGEVMAAVPGKRIAYGMGQNLLFAGAIEYGVMGKEFSAGNLFETVSHNAAFTLSAELAGSLPKGIGWSIGGAMAGLGPWQTLGLQHMTTVSPVLGWGAALGVGAYKLGKNIAGSISDVHDMGRDSRKMKFESGDQSYLTAEAATMRQRALMGIQKSQFSMRNALGNEAAILAGR